MRRHLLLGAVLLAFVPSAFAQPPPASGAGSIELIPVDGANHPISVTFPGQRLRVLGVIRPYIAGQAVEVSFYHGHHLLGVRWAGIRSAGHNTGHFKAGLPVGHRYETITIRATHPLTPLLAAIDAAPRNVKVIPAGAPFGARGAAVRYLQGALGALHYHVPFSGVMDGGTALAVEAFRKLTGLPPTENADASVFERLARGGGSFPVRYRHQGRHFEADLTHQVLAEVNPHGRVRQIFTMSSGKPSTPTVVGTFHIYSKTAGYNSEGMLDSNYFIAGYAIHGYDPVPPYAASHGCLRIPIPDAATVFAWARIGFPVDVYNRSGGGSHRVRHNAGP
jgi:peptidoglycan hydrolase-like protein with peptidoglycan-binding domain